MWWKTLANLKGAVAVLDIQGHKTLLLDTSLPFFSCGLSIDNKIYEKFYPLLGSHSIGIEDRLNEFLKENHIALSDIDSFVYNSGPGSFTGLRIGASFLKGLSSSLRKKMFYIPLDIVVKSSVFNDDNKIIYIRNAKKREFYYMTRNMGTFSLIGLGELEKKYSHYKILYDGNLQYDLEYENYHILPKDFIKNIKHAKIIESGVLKFSYINNPDIR
ncbi:tRNA (adenosine(37)-N6)-threonylcarbamoyltransferase complex dimerization subunit type 1 TsaB [bacterium]|nr:tRNA (adenosine(37)-N6)-threonylcarbamoyltransferase complex dimerization subunit type 1 TsaB [bacterium]